MSGVFGTCDKFVVHVVLTVPLLDKMMATFEDITILDPCYLSLIIELGPKIKGGHY